jgi:hypothetical protein
VVLVLDRSSTMESRPKDETASRRKAALRMVAKAVAELGNTRLVLIDSASATPQEVPSPDVLPDLSATAATDTAADIPALLEKANEFLQTGAPGRTEIWIASDLQDKNWKPESERWQSARAGLAALPQPPKIRVLALTGNAAANASLRTVTTHRSGDTLEIEFEVLRQNDSRQTVNLPLTLAVGNVRTTDTLTVAATRFVSFAASNSPPAQKKGLVGRRSRPTETRATTSPSSLSARPARCARPSSPNPAKPPDT